MRPSIISFVSLLIALGFISDLLAATWVYTANEGGGSLSVIDADSGIKRATIRGFRAPHNIHLGPDGMLYLTDGPANQAVKVDPDKLRILSRWNVGQGLGKMPHGLAISPDGKFAYVANLGSRDLAIVDIAGRKLAASVPLDDAAVQAWVEPQGRFVYVSGSNTGQIFKIDAGGRMVTARILVGKLPAQLGVSPDGKYVISCDQESNQLSIIDMATEKLVKQLPLGTWTHGLSFSPNGKQLFVTNTKSDDVSVIDLTTLSELKRIKVGKRPNGIAASYPNSLTPR